MNQLFGGLFYHSTSQACVVDLTPPTFAGIVSVLENSDGSVTTGYAAASDVTPPITYEIYMLPGSVSAVTLFAATPCDSTRSTTRRTYLDSNGSPRIKDQLYTIGVRARDAANNLNTNTAILTTTAIGSVNLAQVYQDLQTLFALDHSNLLADHANFITDHSNFVTDLAAMEALLDQLQIAVDTINSVNFPELAISMRTMIAGLRTCLGVAVMTGPQISAKMGSNKMIAKIKQINQLGC